jgi:anti-sigma factor RsiW
VTCLRPDRMDLYLEGELDEAERRELEAHLGACPACRRSFEDRRALDMAVAGLPPIEIPPDFAATVLSRLPVDGRPAPGWLAPAITGTAILVAGLLGAHLLTGESLADVVVSLGRSIVGFLSLFVPLFAKAFELAHVFIKLAGEMSAAVLKALGVLSSLLRPEILGFILALAIILSALVLFGFKKIVSLGERS